MLLWDQEVSSFGPAWPFSNNNGTLSSADEFIIGDYDAILAIRRRQAWQAAAAGIDDTGNGDGEDDARVGEARRPSDPIDPWCVVRRPAFVSRLSSILYILFFVIHLILKSKRDAKGDGDERWIWG
jgi:hypothetical protein